MVFYRNIEELNTRPHGIGIITEMMLGSFDLEYLFGPCATLLVLINDVGELL